MSKSSIPAASSRIPTFSVIAIAMMLFAMLFGAGNLIFPPMLGVQAGESFTPAITGFITTAVVLPVIAIIAVTVTGSDMQDLANRGGRVFGLVFPVLVYLSIGAFYGLPRTATVSFSTVVTANFGLDSVWVILPFLLVFFLIAFALAFEPTGIVDRLGKILTPILLILLIVLIVLGVTGLGGQPQAATPEYARSPFVGGFLEGYLTMDSLAALVFGIIVVAALRERGVAAQGSVVKYVAVVGVLAGAMLAVVYVGLGLVGQRMPDAEQYKDGASLLGTAAGQTMGTPGAVVFGLVVLLACLTTAVGLLSATSSYFHKIVPAVSYRWWVGIFCVLACVVATAGLEAVITVAAPLVGMLYPAAIVLIVLSLIQTFVPVRLRYTYFLGLCVAFACALVETISSVAGLSDSLGVLLSWAPGNAESLGWVVPTLVAMVVGAIIDVFVRKEEYVRPQVSAD